MYGVPFLARDPPSVAIRARRSRGRPLQRSAQNSATTECQNGPSGTVNVQPWGLTFNLERSDLGSAGYATPRGLGVRYRGQDAVTQPGAFRRKKGELASVGSQTRARFSVREVLDAHRRKGSVTNHHGGASTLGGADGCRGLLIPPCFRGGAQLLLPPLRFPSTAFRLPLSLCIPPSRSLLYCGDGAR